MLIGVISDIHGPLPDYARDALEGVDAILCAGDVETAQAIWQLEAIAPTIAVAGNCDWHLQGVLDLPRTARPRLGGVRFFLVHRPQDIGTPADDVQVVVHGHTHVPRDETVDGIRYLNPGSACYPRGNSHRSLAIVQAQDGRVSDVRFIDLGPC